MVAPFQFEKSYYLFFGIYGIVNTYVYFLVIQKYLYVYARLDGIAHFMIGLLLLLGLLGSSSCLIINYCIPERMQGCKGMIINSSCLLF